MNDFNLKNLDLTEFLKELGLTELSPAKLEDYTTQILSLLEKRIEERIAMQITDKDRPFIENKSEDEVADYLDSIGINIAEISMQEAQALREDLLQTKAFTDGMIEDITSKNSTED
jgi:hypothetical protein